MSFDLSQLIPSIISGILSGAAGGWLGINIALAKLTTWKDIRDGDIKAMQREMGVHRDDLLVHDYEIGTLMHFNNLKRQPRQPLR